MRPASPVITVTERNTIDKTTAWVTRNSHAESPLVNSTTAIAAATATPMSRRATLPRRSPTAVVNDDGGGSTPASGSADARERRTLGTNTRMPKSTTKGMAGVVLKRGAINTPGETGKQRRQRPREGRPRSASMPFSSVIRGLSTTARILRPSAENLNKAASTTIASTAAPIATSSLRLKAYTLNTS